VEYRRETDEVIDRMVTRCGLGMVGVMWVWAWLILS